MAVLIGIDIGTRGTKAAAFDADGTLLASAFEASRLARPKPGVVEEDPGRQYASVCRTIKECVETGRIKPGAVAAIGIDGQMAGVIGVAADGKHVTPYDSWLDTRCGAMIEKMLAEAGPEIIRKTGGPPSFNHGPKKLWWQKERPADFKRIAAFVQPGAYAAMRLCGLAGSEAFIDHTYLHFSGFADTARGEWDEALCKIFRFERTKLPRIVPPQEIVGTLTAAAARACGLAAGVPVVAGCGDTAASLLACGATKPGICVDVAGTASVFAASCSQFTPDAEQGILSCARSVTPGLWHPYAYVNGGGMNIEWFRGLFAAAEKGRRAAAPPADIAALDRLAAAVEPTDDLPLFVPHLAGRNSPPQPHLRGAWTGLTHAHGAGELFRAVLEGVALEYAVYMAAIRRLLPAAKLDELRVTGGGAASGIWNRIKADTLQLPVRPVVESQGAPAGAAIVAGWGAGLLKSPDAAARQWVETAAAVKPVRSQAALAARRLDRYRRLLRVLDPAAAGRTGHKRPFNDIGDDLL
ncbi:MAG: xylulose kinase [Planctomycetia bacterium]|nr:xylulose kinase [Planctomycetia bacterium]